MKVSHGNLDLPAHITVEKSGNAQIVFTWDTSSVEQGTLIDQVMMLGYDIENRDVLSNTMGQFRSTGTDKMEVPAGKTWHIWFAMSPCFISKPVKSIFPACHTFLVPGY